MVDVRVDHTVLERALGVITRYVYLNDLRMSQRAPLEELQRLIRTATVERTVTDDAAMVCTGCGYRVDACPECGGTDTAHPTAVDEQALRAASEVTELAGPTDCDAEIRPDDGCRCPACYEARVERERVRLAATEERLRRRREQRARQADCRDCGIVFEGHEELARHITEHAGPYCPLCGWWNEEHGEEGGEQDYAQHLNDNHVHCAECDLWFRNAECIQMHADRMETPIGT